MDFRRVQKDHEVIYKNPIKLVVGDPVAIEKWETDPRWLGWGFCKDQNGVSGWVSEKYLQIDGQRAVATKDYDATELTVASGEIVRVEREDFGWAWVQNQKHEAGWVPLENLVSLHFKIEQSYQSAWIDQIMELHNKTEMKRSDAERVDLAFQKSSNVVTCWLEMRLVGHGRIVSDGMYSSIFDLVIDPEFQKFGLGKLIVHELVQTVPKTIIHLTSTFGNEAFYYKLGFRKHKTAMALYQSRSEPSPYLDYDWKPSQP
jgi:GNAT superfamily N-acetyltransferase